MAELLSSPLQRQHGGNNKSIFSCNVAVMPPSHPCLSYAWRKLFDSVRFPRSPAALSTWAEAVARLDSRKGEWRRKKGKKNSAVDQRRRIGMKSCCSWMPGAPKTGDRRRSRLECWWQRRHDPVAGAPADAAAACLPMPPASESERGAFQGIYEQCWAVRRC